MCAFVFVCGVCSLERMNTLLAGGEVPGLFEDEEYTQLMHAVKTSAQRAGLLLDSDDELYRHFVKQVRCWCCCLLMMMYLVCSSRSI